MKQRIDHFGERHAESNSEPKWWCPEFQRKYGRALTVDEMIELGIPDLTDEEFKQALDAINALREYGR